LHSNSTKQKKTTSVKARLRRGPHRQVFVDGTALQLAEKLETEGGGGFTGCGKMQRLEQEASGHDFSRAASTTEQMMGLTGCGKMQRLEQEASGHDFSRAASTTEQMMGLTGCGKMQRLEQEVSGHDFSRAASATKK
jgi:hypothetical protein